MCPFNQVQPSSGIEPITMSCRMMNLTERRNQKTEPIK